MSDECQKNARRMPEEEYPRNAKNLCPKNTQRIPKEYPKNA